MFLILTALPGNGDAVFDRGPPGQEFRIFRPALGQVPGKRPKQDQDRQSQGHPLQDHPDRVISSQQDLDQPHQQIGGQKRRVQLIRAVAAIHESGNSAGDPVKKVPHGVAASVSVPFSPSIEVKYEQVKTETHLFPWSREIFAGFPAKDLRLL